MENNFNISPSPHVRQKIRTNYIMYIVILALLPTTIFGIYRFGAKALMLVLISVISSVLTELLFELGTHKKVTIKDGSAALTGLLLGINLPVGVKWWIPIIGSVFAILIVKQLFGGLGQNFMNPALAARCFLVISFTTQLTNFTYDSFSGATPLALLKDGKSVNIYDMLIGNTAGVIGETSTIAILAGAIIMLLFGVINIRIPFTYLATFTIFIIIFGGHGFDSQYICAQLCGGGLMLGAWFMATDYVTSPITKVGQIVFGILLGILTGLFRLFGATAEGVSYAIIISNLFVPLIEKITIPKYFGKGAK